MNKERPCKGIGKAYGFKGCGTVTAYRTYGLCDTCRASFLLNDERGKIILAKATLKATSPRLKAQKDLDIARVNKNAKTSLGALKKQTQLLFNSYIRMRDEGKPCISSNIPYRKDFDAGHCFSVGSYDGLRYDFDNVHGQSIKDNRFKEGNVTDYLVNLPNRIGKERADALIQRASDYKKNGYKFTRSELLDIQKEVKERIKKLKQ